MAMSMTARGAPRLLTVGASLGPEGGVEAGSESGSEGSGGRGLESTSSVVEGV